ncbi:MAG: AraC family transcriptional regulator [Chitinophagaceae bacterium]
MGTKALISSYRIVDEGLDKAIEAKIIIDRDISRHYTYQDLARMVATNQQKLLISFKEVTRKNLYQYLTYVRIEKAMYLLETTTLTVERIASKVGLDKTNLNKQFKKIHGTTPNAWRKNLWKTNRY